jgi:iron-sulfur cluster insertion protein
LRRNAGERLESQRRERQPPVPLATKCLQCTVAPPFTAHHLRSVASKGPVMNVPLRILDNVVVGTLPQEPTMSAVAENIQAHLHTDDEPPVPLVFTDSAANKVKELVDEEGNPELKLRVFVQGGGCSGFQYGFTFDEIVNDDDTQMSKNGVTLLIDAMSLQYLAGAEIDYKDDLQGAQFVIKNPNATTTCGCGSSFSA